MLKKLKTLLFILSIFTFGVCGCKFDNKKIDSDNKIKPNIITSDFGETRVAEAPEKNPEAAGLRGNTLGVGIDVLNGKFNPIYSNSTSDNWVCNLIFEGLISHDAKGNAIEKIANNWTISEDGKTYNFKLRKDIKFSDGTILNAEDVKFTYTALCDPNYKGVYKNSFKLLEGYKEYVEGNASEVSGIKVISEDEISFTFKEIKASVIHDFSVGILSKRYYNFQKGDIQALNEKNLKPFGSGPYVLHSVKEGEEVSLKKNQNYWQGPPNVDGIIIKVDKSDTNINGLIKGNIDIVRVAATAENVNRFKEMGFLDLYLYDDNGFQYLGLNLRKDIFMKKKVRQALMYGLNRKAFVEEYYGEYGSVINSPVVQSSWAYPESGLNEYGYDKEKSNKLLEDSGWILKNDGFRYDTSGKRLTIKWVTYEGNIYVNKLINRVKEDWKSIGVEVKEEILPFQSLVQRVFESQDFDMYNMAWNLGIDPDPSPLFSMAEDVPGGYNAVGWRNAEGEKLIQTALKELDKEKRKTIYGQWAKLANEELPYIYLNQNKELYAVNCRIKNLVLSPYIDWTTNISKLVIEK